MLNSSQVFEKLKDHRFLDVIKFQVITDKSYKMKNLPNPCYVFSVDLNANKSLIKRVVESIFSVDVKSVNISVQNRLGKSFKGKRCVDKYKIAYVYLSSGSISFEF